MKLSKQVKAFAEAEPWLVSVMANTSALLYETLPDVNWVGFYLMKDNELLIGPFQGKVACIRIPVGKGVCGTAVEQDRLIRVDNVHEFPGHIACDSASESEIVIPIHVDGKVVAVLDIDSPIPARFTQTDEEELMDVVRVIEERAAL
ncbi:MAG: GAF domain-containing protein [Lachnospiraceae bacterium]|nr:GAF domain-containing protein [Lachnospiraceae bacterium]